MAVMQTEQSKRCQFCGWRYFKICSVRYYALSPSACVQNFGPISHSCGSVDFFPTLQLVNISPTCSSCSISCSTRSVGRTELCSRHRRIAWIVVSLYTADKKTVLTWEYSVMDIMMYCNEENNLTWARDSRGPATERSGIGLNTCWEVMMAPTHKNPSASCKVTVEEDEQRTFGIQTYDHHSTASGSQA